MDANVPTLQEEFAGVGMGDVGKVFAQDGGDEFLTYATGRRGVVSAWAIVQTKSRHDLLTRLYHIVRGALDYTYVSGEDRITIDFKLKAPQGTPGAKFCFAVADRKVLRLLRDSRWDLTTFTTTAETTPTVDSSLIVMSENGEVTKAMLQPETGLNKAIGKGADLTWFESLVITDGPAKQPSESKPSLPDDEFHLILTLGLPPKSRVGETTPWISLACNIVDVLYSRQKLLPDVQIPKLVRLSRLAASPNSLALLTWIPLTSLGP
ncbi:hypothetical protein BCR35DRAFT_314392 [Leucosporidium creatinivorum]|uniref:Uncharacterized protein n=1 Tax=Leucosporidium creatinivorum TaxID=106004 RepID=A0A1Y2EZ58_9BASI|nr:hypothetical protein BCR35DRAFT_314392 [Leucosporidium creatinivorum]